MNILRSYIKSLGIVTLMVNPWSFPVSLAADPGSSRINHRSENLNPRQLGTAFKTVNPEDYQWCKPSELDPDKGFTAVQVPLLTSSNTCDGQGPCFKTYSGQVARYTNTFSDAFEEGEKTLVFSDTSGLWCSASNLGCQFPTDFQDLEVLCDTPEVVHKLKSFENESTLPYFATQAANIRFPDSHLCTLTIETSEGVQHVMGVSWSGEFTQNKPRKPLPAKYCPVAIADADAGLFVDTDTVYFPLQAPQTYMIAESRVATRTVSPECTSVYPSWSEAREKPVSPAPVSISEVITAYPQEQVSFCQAFTAGAGKKMAGVEFPEVGYSYGLGDNQKTVSGGCMLIDHQLNKLVNQSVPTVSSDSGYQRITLPVESDDWVEATGFDYSNRAGCVTFENSIKSYNFCRFSPSEDSGAKVYGHLVDGGRKCSGIGIRFNDESSTFEHTIMSGETFEIYMGASASGANVLNTSVLAILTGFIGSLALR